MEECAHNQLVRDENMQDGTYSCIVCGALFSATPFADRMEIVMGTPK